MVNYNRSLSKCGCWCKNNKEVHFFSWSINIPLFFLLYYIDIHLYKRTELGVKKISGTPPFLALSMKDISCWENNCHRKTVRLSVTRLFKYQILLALLCPSYGDVPVSNKLGWGSNNTSFGPDFVRDVPLSNQLGWVSVSASFGPPFHTVVGTRCWDRPDIYL